MPHTSVQPSRAFPFVIALVLACAAPLILFAVMLPVNEYEATLGIHAFDCDGPVDTLLVLIPGMLLALLGLGLAIRHVRLRSSIASGIAIVVAAGLVVAALSKLPSVMAEVRFNAQPSSPCR